jgi:hypothetical protein
MNKGMGYFPLFNGGKKVGTTSSMYAALLLPQNAIVKYLEQRAKEGFNQGQNTTLLHFVFMLGRILLF